MLSETVLVDTGPLIALYSTRDPHHAVCVECVQELPVGKAYTCWPVVSEAVYLLRRYPRDLNRLFEALVAQEFVLLPLSVADLPGIRQVIEKYDDQEVDFADAALVYLAQRESMDTVFTLDHRHFHVYRASDGRPFRLLPESL